MYGYAKFWRRGIIAENIDAACEELKKFVEDAVSMGWLHSRAQFLDTCKPRKESGFAVIEFCDTQDFEVKYLNEVFGGECARPLCLAIKELSEKVVSNRWFKDALEEAKENYVGLDFNQRALIAQQAIKAAEGELSEEESEFLRRMVGPKFFRATINAALKHGHGELWIPPKALISEMYKKEMSK